METMVKKKFIRPPEIKEVYGIPEGTLANLRWAKKGPRYFKRPGGRGVFYLVADVEDWLMSRPIQTLDSGEAK